MFCPSLSSQTWWLIGQWHEKLCPQCRLGLSHPHRWQWWQNHSCHEEWIYRTKPSHSRSCDEAKILANAGTTFYRTVWGHTKPSRVWVQNTNLCFLPGWSPGENQVAMWYKLWHLSCHTNKRWPHQGVEFQGAIPRYGVVKKVVRSDGFWEILEFDIFL